MKMDQLIAFCRIFGSCVFGSPQKNFFFAVPRRGSFGHILTMQLEPPKNDIYFPELAISKGERCFKQELSPKTPRGTCKLLVLGSFHPTKKLQPVLVVVKFMEVES